MIFVTGDCHGNFERFKPKYFPEQAQMTKRDIVICAGDFGGVWFGDGRDEAALDWLESLPWAEQKAMIRRTAFWNRVLRILSESS